MNSQLIPQSWHHPAPLGPAGRALPPLPSGSSDELSLADTGASC